MSYDDFDSDGAATGERRYNKSQSNYRSSTSSNQKASILKNSPLRRVGLSLFSFLVNFYMR